MSAIDRSDIPPVGVQTFVKALNDIVAYLERHTGQAAEIPGDSRVLTPMILHLVARYPKDQLVPIVQRVEALYRLLQTGAPAEWGEPAHIHVAVAEVAAAMPLHAGAFQAPAFCQRVAEVIRQRYPDDNRGAVGTGPEVDQWR